MNLAIIQARAGSSRLPGKVLKEVQGKTLLEHMIERVRAFKKAHKVIVATTQNPKDDAVADIANQLKTDYYRGSEENVLSRFYDAAKKFKATNIIRITADCPLIDPVIADKMFDHFLKDQLDYLSNTLKPTFPDGLDVEIFTFGALETAFQNAVKPSEREHVTPYIWGNPQIFRLGHFSNPEDLSHLRWTVDTETDLEFIREIYKQLYQPGRLFLMGDILQLLAKDPALAKINEGQIRNAGYAASLAKEKRL